MTAEKFKRDAIASYSSRNADTHPTDEQLQEMAEDCCEYIDLMQELMPHECQLAMHFEWVKSHLFVQNKYIRADPHFKDGLETLSGWLWP